MEGQILKFIGDMIQNAPANRPELLVSISNIGKKIKKVKAKMVELRGRSQDVTIDDIEELETYNKKLFKLSIIRAELIYLRNSL